MSSNNETQINHQGVIQRISDGIIYVKILSQASCVSCHAKGACSAADIKEKIIEIKEEEGRKFEVGDNVEVVLNLSAGWKAVLLGYVYPFLLVFITLTIGVNITENQGLVGIISLSLLIPYYIILYITKNKQKKTFSFKIK